MSQDSYTNKRVVISFLNRNLEPNRNAYEVDFGLTKQQVLSVQYSTGDNGESLISEVFC